MMLQKKVSIVLVAAAHQLQDARADDRTVKALRGMITPASSH
jgi:hypothetical protein